MKKVHLVFLAGGVGSRLWPASRKNEPKQFIKFDGEHSPFQKTFLRFTDNITPGIEFFPPTVVTGAAYEVLMKNQVNELGVETADIILEPCARNTAPAIFAATSKIVGKDPQAMILVVPTDHLIHSIDDFISSVALGLKAAEEGDFVCLGVVPNRPEVGYGYMEAKQLSGERISKVTKFHEKPSARDAGQMLQSGNFYWNAGVFLFKGNTLLTAVERYEAKLVKPVLMALKNSEHISSCIKLNEADWTQAPNISIDYAILEKAKNVSAVKYYGHWSDIGDWQGFHRESQKDEYGVAKIGSVTSVGSNQSLLFCDDPDIHLFGLDIQNLAVVVTKDAVLVAPISSAQKVGKHIVAMEKAGVSQASTTKVEKRPWGSFEVLSSEASNKVKRLMVEPGKVLSLQSHKYRSENWIVVSGTATVTLAEKTFLLQQNETVFIPQGIKHRVLNATNEKLEILELQTGSYFGEDDIIRYSDEYGRA